MNKAVLPHIYLLPECKYYYLKYGPLEKADKLRVKSIDKLKECQMRTILSYTITYHLFQLAHLVSKAADVHRDLPKTLLSESCYLETQTSGSSISSCFSLNLKLVHGQAVNQVLRALNSPSQWRFQKRIFYSDICISLNGGMEMFIVFKFDLRQLRLRE